MVRKLNFDPHKFLKLDNCWLTKLGEKKTKFLRKFALAMTRFTDGNFLLPFDLPLISAELLYREKDASWFDNETTECKILLRVQGLDEEGIGMHLTEISKVVQWILWAPLIGDPCTSKQVPDRVWRETTFSGPAEFIQSFVDDSKIDVLQELVTDRWDTGMMLGGSDRVKNLIYKHISSDNEELRQYISECLGFLKWHQEFDWEEISENLLFGCRYKFPDIF